MSTNAWEGSHWLHTALEVLTADANALKYALISVHFHGHTVCLFHRLPVNDKIE